MLRTGLLERSQGDLSNFAFASKVSLQLLHALHPAPDVLFDGQGHSRPQPERNGDTSEQQALAHKSGVNSLAIDRFEGR